MKTVGVCCGFPGAQATGLSGKDWGIPTTFGEHCGGKGGAPHYPGPGEHFQATKRSIGKPTEPGFTGPPTGREACPMLCGESGVGGGDLRLSLLAPLSAGGLKAQK